MFIFNQYSTDLWEESDWDSFLEDVQRRAADGESLGDVEGLTMLLDDDAYFFWPDGSRTSQDSEFDREIDGVMSLLNMPAYGVRSRTRSMFAGGSCGRRITAPSGSKGEIGPYTYWFTGRGPQLPDSDEESRSEGASTQQSHDGLRMENVDVFVRWTPEGSMIIAGFGVADFLRRDIGELVTSHIDSGGLKSITDDPYLFAVFVFEHIWLRFEIALKDLLDSSETFGNIFSYEDVNLEYLHKASADMEIFSGGLSTTAANLSILLEQRQEFGRLRTGDKGEDFAAMEVSDRLKMTIRRLQSLRETCEGAKSVIELALSVNFNLMAQRDSATQKKMAENARLEAITMRNLTFLAAGFLPASFIASIFGMAFFDLDEKKLVISPSIWSFFAIVCPITITVLTTFIWYDKKERANALKATEKEDKTTSHADGNERDATRRSITPGSRESLRISREGFRGRWGMPVIGEGYLPRGSRESLTSNPVSNVLRGGVNFGGFNQNQAPEGGRQGSPHTRFNASRKAFSLVEQPGAMSGLRMRDRDLRKTFSLGDRPSNRASVGDDQV